jgi:hypothetical protein
VAFHPADWQGITAGVAFKEAEQIGVEVFVDVDQRIHLAELDPAFGGFIANLLRQGKQGGLHHAGGDGLETFKAHGGQLGMQKLLRRGYLHDNFVPHPVCT